PSELAHGKVHREQIPVLEPITVRQTVQHGIVDRGAQHLPERARPEGGVVVDVAGRRTGFADHPVCQGVQFEQAHSYVGGVVERSQDTRDEFAGRAHLLDLGGSFEFDHASTLMRPSADARSHSTAPGPHSPLAPRRPRSHDRYEPGPPPRQRTTIRGVQPPSHLRKSYFFPTCSTALSTTKPAKTCALHTPVHTACGKLSARCRSADPIPCAHAHLPRSGCRGRDRGRSSAPHPSPGGTP